MPNLAYASGHGFLIRPFLHSPILDPPEIAVVFSAFPNGSNDFVQFRRECFHPLERIGKVDHRGR